jgi:hypothetical protein
LIVWVAIGYRDDSAWVKLPEVKDAHGNFVQQGISPLPNFYFIGRPWQRSRGAALIMGVGDDAAWMRERILTDLGGQEQSQRNALPRLIGGGRSLRASFFTGLFRRLP